jgi:hypothetical protein
LPWTWNHARIPEKKINGQGTWVVRHARVEWGKRNSEFCLVNLYNILLWCEQWVNETNNCIERKRGPFIPLDRVSAKTKWKRGRKIFGTSCVKDTWIRCGRKFTKKGKHDNLVVRDFMSQMRVLREEETRGIIITYSLWHILG